MIAASMEGAISTSSLACKHQNGLPALTFHQKAASSGMQRWLFQEQSRDNAGTMIPTRHHGGWGMQ
jgi:hypothetical protein